MLCILFCAESACIFGCTHCSVCFKPFEGVFTVLRCMFVIGSGAKDLYFNGSAFL